MTEIIPRKWFVVYTKPRNEIKVSQRLSALGIENYTPTKVEIRQWSDRKKKVEVPLLPSMVLVRLQEKDVNKVFEIPAVVRYLFEKGKRAEVSNDEVIAMQSYLNSIKVKGESNLVVGDIVKVPLLDEQAVLLSKKGKKCLAQLKKLGAIVSFQLN
jgi:transcription antitermination factor NusG